VNHNAAGAVIRAGGIMPEPSKPTEYKIMTRQMPTLSDHSQPVDGNVPPLSTLPEIDVEPKKLSGPAIRVLELNDVEELRRYKDALDGIAEFAAEPNVFFEPWMLFPALEAYGRRKLLVFLLLFTDDHSGDPANSKLCGFIPLERRAWFHGLPFPALTLWRYPHSFLATPLLKKGRIDEAMDAFFTWVHNRRRGALLLELPRISGVGDLHTSLERALRDQHTLEVAETCYERALFRPRINADAYLREALSKKRRKEFRRLERRLSGLGQVSFVKMSTDDSLKAWVEEFLQLEATGWKGRKGTAFAAQEQSRVFFLKIAEGAARCGRLEMLALRLDGKAIAIKCNLLAKNGGFAFKIAYDENFYRYSPGVLLELAQISRLHDDSTRQWMDSCADHDHFMANRLWLDRKPLRTVVVSTGHPLGNMAVRIVRFLKSILRNSANRASGREPERAQHDYESILPGSSR
jgi:hypothetical protein